MMTTTFINIFLVNLVQLIAVQHVSATDGLTIREGNGTVVLSVTAKPGVLQWNSYTEDAVYTCEASVVGSVNVWLLDVGWSPPEGLQRFDYGIRWEETNSTNWQGQELTMTSTLRLRNAVPEDAGTYNCSVTYQPNIVSSSYHVWTATRLEVNEDPPAKGEMLLPVYLGLTVALGSTATMINLLVCCLICKMKDASRVHDRSEPGKRRKRSGASVKRNNSVSPAGSINSPQHPSWQPLPQLNAVPSISIIEAQESQFNAIEQHLQQLDDISEEHEEVFVRPKGTNGREVQGDPVQRTEVTTTYMHEPEKLNTVRPVGDALSERLDVDDQRACSGGSQRSTNSSGYGSMPSTPRTRPAIPRSDKNMASTTINDLSAKNLHSTQVKQNTWVNPNVEMGDDQHQLQSNAQNETTTSMPHDHDDNTTDEDRQGDLELFNKLSLDRDNFLREENIFLRLQLQTNFSSTNFASGVFDQIGGHLSLPYHDINLFIPPGAIEAGQLKTIHIFVPPSMNRGKPTPIVHCGPTGTTFADHVVLSFPVDPKYDKIVPKFTNTEVGSEEEWQPLLEDNDAASIVQNGRCTLFLSHFTGFGAEATEEETSSGTTVSTDGKKIIRVGAFASKHTSDDGLYQLRIRIYDTNLGWIRRHRRLLHHPASKCQSTGNND
ncbi:uncharacterized protein [Branchiostoma lanceolatum]|uniref:uncharacterized protein n=1 Tax=Branchiostoma lanceolatum TaxID=7740 RepID=UPI0034535252